MPEEPKGGDKGPTTSCAFGIETRESWRHTTSMSGNARAATQACCFSSAPTSAAEDSEGRNGGVAPGVVSTAQCIAQSARGSAGGLETVDPLAAAEETGTAGETEGSVAAARWRATAPMGVQQRGLFHNTVHDASDGDAPPDARLM